MAEDETVAEEVVTEQPDRLEELGAIFDDANKAEDDGQSRDEQGRFAAKEASDAEPVEAESEGAAETEIKAEPSAEAEPEPETVLDVPSSWSATAAANWPSLSRELQEEILKREGDWQKADGERATQLQGYEPIQAAIAPAIQQMRLNGQEPAQFISQLVSADQYLRTDPQAAIQWLAKTYGIDLSQAESEPVDPVLAPFVDEINALKGQISQFADSQQQADAQRVNAEIEMFAKDRPHFEEVRQHMGALIQAGTAADMSAAYDMAVWANPTTRAAMQAEQSTETEEKRKAETEEKAVKAKRINDTNLSTQGTAGGSTPPQYKTRLDELGAIYDQTTGA